MKELYDGDDDDVMKFNIFLKSRKLFLHLYLKNSKTNGPVLLCKTRYI